MAYVYPASLAIISIVVMTLERLLPWRKEQKLLRPRFWSDLFHLVFNGHFLGVILYGIAANYVIPRLDDLLGPDLKAKVYRNVAADWPIWMQILVALFALDFVQWCVHNLLHRLPFLWEFHKTHHSVVDGEMDWIVSFRFQWTEVVLYKSVQYLPLAFFGFGIEATLFHAIFGTLIGHLNHSNLDLGHGPWRFLLNSPRMHIWHHDFRGDSKTTVNFGIIFSLWDWIFGTAKIPEGQSEPQELGFPGVESFPKNFFAQEAWPLGRDRAWAGVVGAALISVGWWLHLPKPSADVAIAQFGEDAKREGYAHPEELVSAAEVAAALQSDRLVLLDVRPVDRFTAGHIPSARQVYRDDYSLKAPWAGPSRNADELEAMLRAKGVFADSVVVLYGDGGPEPYRLWWTLRAIGGYRTRVLDGGLIAWKAGQHPVESGTQKAVAAGDVKLFPPKESPPRTWADFQAWVRSTKLIDARSKAEWLGEEKAADAAKPGRIPGAIHMEWTEILRGKTDPRLLPPKALVEAFSAHNIGHDDRVVTSCQSGTRSAATYFALYELGYPEGQISNYEGSWGEYSRLNLPIATGPEPEHP